MLLDYITNKVYKRKVLRKKGRNLLNIVSTWGFQLYLDPSDQVTTPLILNNTYESTQTKIIAKLIKKDMVVIDLGAHIGYYSLLFAKLVGKNGKVISYEPSKDNFRILKLNKNMNKLGQLKVLNFAVSNKTGVDKLYLSEDNSGDHRINILNDQGRNFEKVKVTTLDHDFNNQKIDFIKIDIQGSEPLALQGMTKLLKNNPQITLITEYWPFGIRQIGLDPIKFLDELEKLGFYIYNINENKGRMESMSKWSLIESLKENKFTNLLCSKSAINIRSLNSEKKKSISNFKQLKESYDRIWREGNLYEEVGYYKWIIELLGAKAGNKLLDVACGAGYLLEQSEKIGIAATGIEISTEAIKKAKKNAPKSYIVEGVAEKLPFESKSYDYITCLGSLEHFLKPKKALHEMHRVLKDDGLMATVLPNRWPIYGILEGVVRGNELNHGQELERYYTLKEALDLLAEGGFKPTKILSYNRKLPTDLRTGTKLSTFANWIYKNIFRFIRWHIPVRLSYVFVFILKKNDIPN